MANLVLCGFEWGQCAHEADTVYINGITTYGKRSGNYGFSFSQQNWEKSFVAISEGYLQVAFKFVNYITKNIAFFWIRKDSNAIGSFAFDDGAHLCYYAGDKATKLITADLVCQTNIWYVLELHLKIHDTEGIAEMRIDGNAQGSFNGDTKPGNDTIFNYFKAYVPPSAPECYIDDVIINDTTGQANNSWPNGMKIVLLKPNADGGTLEWTATPGPTHYTAIDEVAPSGTDYIKVLTADKTDLLDCENLPAEAQSVKIVALDALAFKGGVTSPTQLALIANIDETNYEQTTKQLLFASSLVRSTLDLNPAGGGFTVSGVNAMKLGVKSKA